MPMPPNEPINASLLAATIVKFLEREASSTTSANNFDEEQKEGLKVAASCIRHTYGLSSKNLDHASVPELHSLLSSQHMSGSTAEAPCSMNKTAISEQRREEAERQKNEGNQFLVTKKSIEAAECYTKAIELDPQNAVYYCNRAAAFTMQKDYESAIEDCLAAISLSPDYAKAYSRLGTAYLGLKDYEKACEAFEKAMKLEPDNISYKSSAEQARQQIPNKPSQSTSPANDGDSPLPSSPMQNLFGAGGMPDLGALLGNPQLMEMAGRMMRDPNAMRNLMNNPNIAAMMQGMTSGTRGGARPAEEEPPNQQD